MSRPPVIYPATLADLIMLAEMASELDAYKDCLAELPHERARIIALLERAHDRVEELAGIDAALVYCADEPLIGGAL